MSGNPFPKEGRQTIKRKVVRGGAWLYSRMLVTNVVNLGVMAILARKLSPADFGLVALAQVVIRFLVILGSDGFNQFVIYDNETGREERVHAAFWMDLVFSLLGVILGLFLVPFVSRFYSEPALSLILIVMLLRYPIDTISKIPDALIKKNLDFQKLEIRDGILEIGKAVISVSMALTGFGVWSIVIPGVVASPIRAVVAFKMVAWRPHLRLYLQHWRRIFNYTINIIGGTVLHYVISEGDTLLIGKLMGSYNLGIYNLAWQSANLVNRTIVTLTNKLTLPTFSVISGTVKSLRNGLENIMRVLSVVTIPLLVGLFIIADDFVLTIYGQQWANAILPMRILIIYAIRYAVGSPTGAIYKTIGRPDVGFKLMLLIAPFYLFSIWAGSFFGIVGVAVAVTLVRTAFGILDFGIVGHYLHSSLWQIIKPVLPACGAAGLMGVVVLAAKYGIRAVLPVSMITELFLLVAIGGIVYLILIRSVFKSLAVDITRISTPLLGRYQVFADKLLNLN